MRTGLESCLAVDRRGARCGSRRTSVVSEGSAQDSRCSEVLKGHWRALVEKAG